MCLCVCAAARAVQATSLESAWSSRRRGVLVRWAWRPSGCLPHCLRSAGTIHEVLCPAYKRGAVGQRGMELLRLHFVTGVPFAVTPQRRHTRRAVAIRGPGGLLKIRSNL